MLGVSPFSAVACAADATPLQPRTHAVLVLAGSAPGWPAGSAHLVRLVVQLAQVRVSKRFRGGDAPALVDHQQAREQVNVVEDWVAARVAALRLHGSEFHAALRRGWRVLQSVLSNPELAPLERRRIKQAFDERLGAAMLQGPLRDAALPKAPSRAVGGSSNAAAGDRAGR